MNKDTSVVSEKVPATSSAGHPSEKGKSEKARPMGNSTYQPDESKSGENLARAIRQAESLIAYATREGHALDPELLEILLNARESFRDGSLTAKPEVKFWLAYNRLVRELAPVTVEDLKENPFSPAKGGKGQLWDRGKTLGTANRMIRYYRLFAAFSLILLLITQIYWFIGSEVSMKLERIYTQYDAARTELVQYRVERKLSANQGGMAGDTTLMRLEKQRDFLNGLADTHYELLESWNKVWQTILFMEPFEGKITPYDNFTFEADQRQLREELEQIDENTPLGGAGAGAGAGTSTLSKRNEIMGRMDKAIRGYKYNEAVNRLYLNRVSASFVLSALQGYLLPLLYGLLGAAVYILRQLSIATREMTFTQNTALHFRLRLLLGALTGMSIGWFVSPEGTSNLAISPFALAFLVGYNLEIMFMLMDKFIHSVNGMIGDRSNESKRTTPPENHGPTPKVAPPDRASATSEAKTAKTLAPPESSATT
uniref:Uncharacterized protein n=1 Tax=Candidatus Kentrum sp. LFY TaxID=2126342 RepID=A0A450WXV0_9GAMM|nr:MAG: hypothetical protein BECKLFY1418C_GA0070996_11053 [Candidatus Kentron sp. LFY]